MLRGYPRALTTATPTGLTDGQVVAAEWMTPNAMGLPCIGGCRAAVTQNVVAHRGDGKMCRVHTPAVQTGDATAAYVCVTAMVDRQSWRHGTYEELIRDAVSRLQVTVGNGEQSVAVSSDGG